MAELSGRTGGVYADEYILCDCEAAWDTAQGVNVVCSADNTVYKVGAYSAKMAVAEGVGAAALIATEAVTSKDITTYELLVAWLRSTVALTADDWNLYLDETAACGGTIDKTLSIPALAASTWTRVAFDLGTVTGLDAIIAIGVYQKADKAALDFNVDDVGIYKLIDGIKSWTLDYTLDVLETTDFGDGQASNSPKSYTPGLSGWSGSFEGYKDGVPQALSFSSLVTLILTESETTGQSWIGDVYITGIHPSVSVDGIVSYTYDFQGSGELTEAVA